MRFISNCNGNGIASKKLQNEIDELTNQLGNTQEDLTNETSARQLADNNLQDRINTETSIRQYVDRGLQSQIDEDKQDLADYKTAMANTINTGTVNANSMFTESLAAHNSASVGNQLSIICRGISSSGIMTKTFDGVYVNDSDNWYLLAQWTLDALPEVECVFGQGSVSGGFKLTPEVIETKGNDQVQIALGRQGNNAILAIKGSCTIISFVAKYNNAYSFTANTSALTTIVEETDIQSTYAIDGHVYLNNFAVPQDLRVSRVLTAHQLTSTNNSLENALIQNADVDNLTNSERNTKKNYVLLDTHQTNTRYYIMIPKFNGKYTCTLIKDDVQLFSFELLEHGDYIEVDYSSIDANEATVDTYLEEFYVDDQGRFWFKTFGDGELYYSYSAEGDLNAPAVYSYPPENIEVDYVCQYHTRKVILGKDLNNGLEVVGKFYATQIELPESFSINNLEVETLKVNETSELHETSITGDLSVTGDVSANKVVIGDLE